MLYFSHNRGNRVVVDRDRLVKLLNMTASSHDSEALAAMRHSNQMLRQANMSWADLIAVATEPPPARAPTEPKAEPDIRRHDPPSPRSANWGRDLFGDEPSITRSADPKKAQSDQLALKRRVLRGRIRAVPFVLRLLFFPIWVFAETYAALVHGGPLPGKIIAFLAPVAVGAAAGAFWIVVVNELAKWFGFGRLI